MKKHNKEEINEVGKEVMDFSKKSLLIKLHYFAYALSKLEFKQIEDKKFETNGKFIAYNPLLIMRNFKKDQITPLHDLLHMFLHCILRHMFNCKGKHPVFWNIACDITVEKIILELKLGLIPEMRTFSIEYNLAEIKKSINPMTTEYIYDFLLKAKDYLSKAQIKNFDYIFKVDDHRSWYIPLESNPDKNSNDNSSRQPGHGQNANNNNSQSQQGKNQSSQNNQPKQQDNNQNSNNDQSQQQDQKQNSNNNQSQQQKQNQNSNNNQSQQQNQDQNSNNNQSQQQNQDQNSNNDQSQQKNQDQNKKSNNQSQQQGQNQDSNNNQNQQQEQNSSPNNNQSQQQDNKQNSNNNQDQKQDQSNTDLQNDKLEKKLSSLTAQEISDMTQMWADLSRQAQLEIQQLKDTTPKKDWDNSFGSLIQAINIANIEKCNYSQFLKKFSKLHEVMEINNDEFDYNFYTYGLNIYKNIPLIEPLEYKETKRIKDFVIAIDTSCSVQGPLVQKFVEKTYNILKTSETFTKKMNLHIIQCDNKIQEVATISSQREFDKYISTMKLHGFGGTNFNPVFNYVEEQIEKGTFHDLKGLIYLSDGLGPFPEKRPSFTTAFLLPKLSYENKDIPSWVIREYIDENEFN